MASYLGSLISGGGDAPAAAQQPAVGPGLPRAEALSLIDVDDEGAFAVNEESAQILAGIEGKLCVVCVAGLYRTGKSTIANLLADAHGKRGNFTIGHGVRRCTRGIWLWGAPVRTTLATGEPCTIVLLDVEGLGGLEADGHYDTRLFALAALLCSTLVYNSLGAVDEHAISNLAFVANLTQHVRITEDDHPGEGDFERHFPAFVWVVRDFALDLEDERGDAIDANEYLENALREQVGFDAATAERNRVRHMLKAFFSERRCFCLERPVLDEDRLQNLQAVPVDELRPAFLRSFAELREHVRAMSAVKRVRGRAVSGRTFVELCRRYVDTLQSGGVPTVATAWEEVMARECARARAEALETYEAAFATHEDVEDDETLLKTHRDAAKRALGAFRAQAGGATFESSLGELEAECLQRLETRRAANFDQSAKACDALCARLHDAEIAPKLGSAGDRYADAAALAFDARRVAAMYEKGARGPARPGRLAAYFSGRILDAYRVLFDANEDAHHKALDAAEAQARGAAQSLARCEEHKKAALEQLEVLRAEVVAVSGEKMRVEAQHKAALDRARTLEGEGDALRRRADEAHQDLEDARERLESEQTWQAQLHARLEAAEVEKGETSSRLAELGAALDERRRDEAAARAELGEKREREEALKAELADAARAAAAVAAQLRDAEARLAQAERAGTSAKAERDERTAALAAEREQAAATREALAALERNVEALHEELAAAHRSRGAAEEALDEARNAGDASREAAEEQLARGAAKEEELEAALRGVSTEKAALEAERADLQKALADARDEALSVERARKRADGERAELVRKAAQRTEYLQQQLDAHRSGKAAAEGALAREKTQTDSTTRELDALRAVNAERASTAEARIHLLEKQLEQAKQACREAERRAASLKSSLESSASELNAVAAQRAVLLDEKEKMQALWEKSLTDHFHSLHEAQATLGDVSQKADARHEATASRVAALESQLDDYRRIVDKVQTRREGLLRKRTRSRLVKQTWHVKCFRLVGGALLHGDRDGAGEKALALDARATAEAIKADVRNAFRVRNSNGDELQLAAIDRVDMDEWLAAVAETVADLRAAEDRVADQAERFKQESEN